MSGTSGASGGRNQWQWMERTRDASTRCSNGCSSTAVRSEGSQMAACECWKRSFQWSNRSARWRGVRPASARESGAAISSITPPASKMAARSGAAIEAAAQARKPQEGNGETPARGRALHHGGSEVRGGYGLVARVVLVCHFEGLAIDFPAAQHDLDDLACVGDVEVRAAVDDDQRGELAGFDRAPVAGTDEACGVAGRDRDRFERRQPC